MLRRVGAGGQFSFHRRLDKSAGVAYEGVQRHDADIQVVFDLVEIAVVRVGNRRRNIALRNPVNVLGRHVQRADYRVERLVDAFDDLAEVALMLRRVGTGRQFSFHGRLCEHCRVGCHHVHRTDALIQVVLDFVEIAVIGVRDHRGDIALRNPVNVLRRHVQRSDNGVYDLIDRLHTFLVGALQAADVGANVKFAVTDSGCQRENSFKKQRSFVSPGTFSFVVFHFSSFGYSFPGNCIHHGSFLFLPFIVCRRRRSGKDVLLDLAFHAFSFLQDVFILPSFLVDIVSVSLRPFPRIPPRPTSGGHRQRRSCRRTAPRPASHFCVFPF